MEKRREMVTRQKFEPQKEESFRSQMDDQKSRTFRIIEEESRAEETGTASKQEKVFEAYKMMIVTSLLLINHTIINMYRGESKEQQSKENRDALIEIFNNFKSRSGRGSEFVINLKDIESYFAKMKSEKKDLGCSIFENKIKRLPQSRKTMTQEQFMDYFNQNVATQSHFEDIFSAIDTDGTAFISKKQLKQLIRKFNLSYTQRDVNLMMEVVSSDGQKVSKSELMNFLCRN